jgi:branched-chain amino acid transport system permease protein
MLTARDWVELTRGAMGIPGLPAPTLTLPWVGTILFDRPSRFYEVMAVFALLSLACVHRILRSRIGRTLVAIKLNEPMASSQGIDPLRYRLLALGVSAVITGIAGGLYVFSLTIVDPSVFDFYYTETMLIMVIIGGPGSFWGVLAACLVFSVVPDLLRFSTDLRMVLYGVVLVAAMLAFPGGLAGFRRRRRA